MWNRKLFRYYGGGEGDGDNDGCEHGDYSADSDADSPDTDAGGIG